MSADLAGAVLLSTLMARCRIRGTAAVRMAERLGGPEGFPDASDRALAEALGGPADAVEAMLRILGPGRGRDEAVRWADALSARGVVAAWIGGPGYPERLRTIAAPPPVLFVRSRTPGALALFDRACVAVIGTRQPTGYGEQAAVRLARDLAAQGAVVVSGLAAGIDTRAHEGALACGGATVAVLANGIDTVYPRENEGLAERIAASGAVVTELPPGTPPRANLFPARNRIISGLCDATAVVEAAARSGTMITAGCALDQGRDVFAVPGSIFSERSDGTNQLLKEGAFVLTDAEDLLGRLPASRRLGAMRFLDGGEGTGEGTGAPGLAERILRSIASDPQDADALSERLGSGIRETVETLSVLEMQGLARRVRGHYEAADGSLYKPESDGL